MRSLRTEELALLTAEEPLPKSGAAPEWITIFPKIGPIQTRDGRNYTVDAGAIIRAFEADGVDIPVDLNHATDTAMAHGKEAPAVGWVKALKVEGGALRGKVDWLTQGKETLAGRSYRYVSPSFWHTPEKDGNKTTRLKAVALVTAPALGQQQALASAQGGSSSALAANSGELVYGVVATALPNAPSLSDWVVVFPALGFVETLSEDVFYIDGKEIVDNFARATRGREDDYREFPVGLDHRAEIAIERGEDYSEQPLGFVKDLRINSGRLEAMVGWAKDASIVAKNGRTAVSPTFFVEVGGKVKRLKSLSLVRRAQPFAKARALGNDVAPQERGYETPKPVVDAKGQEKIVDDKGEIVEQMAAIARSRPLAEGELLAYTMTRIETELKRGGLSVDMGYVMDMAGKLVNSAPAYALKQLQDWGQPAAASARRSNPDPDPLQRIDEDYRQTKMRDAEVACRAQRIAQKAEELVAEAAAEGQELSYIAAVSLADEQLSASLGSIETGSVSAGSHLAPERLGCLPEAMALLEKANALIATAEAAGNSLDLCSALVMAEASDNRESCSPAHLIALEANKRVACSSGAVSFSEAVEQLAARSEYRAYARQPWDESDSGSKAYQLRRSPGSYFEATALLEKANALIATAEAAGNSLDLCSALVMAEAGDSSLARLTHG